MKCFEAQHMFGDPLDETMILFKNIVQAFDLQNFNLLSIAGDFQDIVYSLRTGQIGAAFIHDDRVWNTTACDGLLKETPCSTQVSTLGKHKIKRLSVTINSPIQINPFGFDLYIGFVNAR